MGIGDYRASRFADLPACPREAGALASALMAPGGCAVPAKNVASLLDSDATNREVLDALQQAAARAGPEEVVFFYFAGHGMRADRGFVLCTSGFDGDDPVATGLTSEVMAEVLEATAARGLLVVLDCCGGAAFAEAAPALFTHSQRGDFRILVSASRAQQSSWELPEHGSLFTPHLLNVLQGKVHLSGPPGQIYFSDLFAHLHDSVAEDIETRYGGRLQQEPVFIGSYTRDPLLFVHTELTLSQIRLRTQRYSHRQLRRMVSTTAAMILLVFAFVVGTYWAFMDKHQFLRLENSSVALYQGHPGLTGFGLPRRLWVFELDQTDLGADSPLSRGEAVVSDMGEQGVRLLPSNLAPTSRALWHLWSGDHDLARREAFEELQRSKSEQPDAHSRAAQIVAGAATMDEIGLLEQLAAHKRWEVHQGAIRALQRLDHTLAVHATEALNYQEFIGSHMQLMAGWRRPCTPDLARYLRSFIDLPGNAQFTRLIIDASLRTGCNVGLDWIGDVQPAHVDDVAIFALAIGYGTADQMRASARDMLAVAQSAPADERPHRLARTIQFQSGLPEGTCPEVLLGNVNQIASWARPRAALVLHRDCPDAHLELRRHPVRGDTLTLSVLDVGTGHREFVQKVTIDAQFSELFDVLEVVKRAAIPNAIEVVSGILAVTADSDVRREAIRALRELGAPSTAASAHLDDPQQEVQVEAYRWLHQDRPEIAFDLLMVRIGDPTAGFLPGLLASWPLSEDQAAKIRAAVANTPMNVRRRAALTMVAGTQNEALRMLVDLQAEIRGAAASYAGYRDDIDVIRHRVAERLPYPTSVVSVLEAAAAQRRDLMDELSSVPEWAMPWRIKLIEDLRILNDGVRLWLQSMRIQLGRG